MKVKLKNLSSVVYTEEHIQEVEYLYSIEDSLGLLKIVLTIPENSDPAEYFALHIKDLYKGYNHYTIYHSKYKYDILVDRNTFQLNKNKMW